MRKPLLLMTAALCAALTLHAEDKYELVFVGKKADGNTATANPTKGQTMTKQENGSWTCTVQEIDVVKTGFKIVNNDTDAINAVPGSLGVEKWSGLSAWHTQFGAGHGVAALSLDADAEPLLVTDFVTLNKGTGHSPGELTFTGGVQKASNVTITFWPNDKMVSATGTVTSYQDMVIQDTDEKGAGIANVTDNTTKEVTTQHVFALKHEGNGKYSGEYDFGNDNARKTFIIHAKAHTKPCYGFADDTEDFGTENKSRATVSYTRTLIPYSINTENARQPGVPNGTASISKVVSKSAAATLTGVHSVEFDANTGELTLTADESTGIDNVAGDDSLAPVQYYNLQGIQVENPCGGIFLRRQGNAVTKVVL